MIKVLVITTERSGVDMYRLNPHRYMDSEKFQVAFTPTLDNPADDLTEKLKEFDVVVFSRMLSRDSQTDYSADIMTHLNKAKCKVVVDYDDSWNLPKYHDLYKTYEKNGYRLRQVKAARFADGVTVSTPYLENKILSYNKNTEVIKNCVDYKDVQWTKFKTKSDRLRVAFIGAKDHVKDMAMIDEQLCMMQDLDIDLIYGGWAPGEQNNKIASYMSCKGTNDNFDVIPALDVTCYGQMYNHVDVCLAPLHKDEFTQCKSELKALEAGFMDCAIIASNQIPFTYVCNEDNSILVDKNGWYDAVKSLVDNRDRVKELAEALNKDVMKHYDIENEVAKREAFYEKLCKKKN